MQVVGYRHHIRPPHNQERIEPNPNRGTNQRQWIELLFSLRHRVRNRAVLDYRVGE